MRVLVNQLTASGTRTGIGHYTAQLLRCLHEQAPDAQIDPYPQGWLGQLRDWVGRLRPRSGPQGDSNDRLRQQLVQHVRQLGRDMLAQHFRVVCARKRCQLYHEPNFIPIPCDLPTVATLHDLSVLLHPEWHPADRVHHFEKHFQRGLAQCSHFLTISEFGRQEVIRTLHIAPERVTRTYMGVRPGLGPLSGAETAEQLAHLGLPPQYLLYLGTIEPRKNLLRLMQVYCSLDASLRERWPLLLAGGWGWNTSEVRDYYQTEARHRGVRHLGYTAERHLRVLYNGARALVYPSLYEGFGLPPVEMMACGGAVLASNAGALVETVGGRACLLNPYDSDAWRAALQSVTTDDDWWRSLRRGVCEQARGFTWDRCAADTLRVYQSLCGVSARTTQPLRLAA